MSGPIGQSAGGPARSPVDSAESHPDESHQGDARNRPLREYLEATPIVDWDEPEVLALANDLAQGSDDPVAVARRCFEWVRDEIKHSGDHCLNPVTCSASDVLRHGTGFCYAKSHLLAALLRANKVPAGFCYQRLSADASGTSFRLHGLNAALLPGLGWYRIDPRGNRPGVDTRFDPPSETLAFDPSRAGESTFDGVWPAPLPVVVTALTEDHDAVHLRDHLPDMNPDPSAMPKPPEG